METNGSVEIQVGKNAFIGLIELPHRTFAINYCSRKKSTTEDTDERIRFFTHRNAKNEQKRDNPKDFPRIDLDYSIRYAS